MSEPGFPSGHLRKQIFILCSRLALGNSLLGKDLHPCAEAPRTFYRQTSSNTRSVPSTGLRNVGGTEMDRTWLRGWGGCHRPEARRTVTSALKGCSITLRARLRPLVSGVF